MEFEYNFHSKKIKFNAHPGGSLEYKESEKTVNFKAELLKMLTDLMSKASSFARRIYAKIRSKFSS